MFSLSPRGTSGERAGERGSPMFGVFPGAMEDITRGKQGAERMECARLAAAVRRQ